MLKFLREKRFIITVVFLILLPLLFLSSGAKSKGERAWYDQIIYYITEPFQSIITRTVESTFHLFDGYISLIHTKAQNQELHQKVDLLTKEVQNLSEIRLENERLRTLLNFRQRVSPFMIPAQVIAKDASNEFEAIKINKGSIDGIKPSMAVVTPQGIVGRVLNVASDYSVVLTVIDPASRIDALIQRSRARGIVIGVVGGLCVMKYVTRTDDVQEGDQVISSGLASFFPKGIQVGTVHKVIKKPYGISQYVEIKPSVDFSKLEEVFVVISMEPVPAKTDDAQK